jgi:hypothetical protein
LKLPETTEGANAIDPRITRPDATYLDEERVLGHEKLRFRRVFGHRHDLPFTPIAPVTGQRQRTKHHLSPENWIVRGGQRSDAGEDLQSEFVV